MDQTTTGCLPCLLSSHSCKNTSFKKTIKHSARQDERLYRSYDLSKTCGVLVCNGCFNNCGFSSSWCEAQHFVFSKRRTVPLQVRIRIPVPERLSILSARGSLALPLPPIISVSCINVFMEIRIVHVYTCGRCSLDGVSIVTAGVKSRKMAAIMSRPRTAATFRRAPRYRRDGSAPC